MVVERSIMQSEIYLVVSGVDEVIGHPLSFWTGSVLDDVLN